MKLPNYESAIVPRDKIVNYLLSESHSDGRHKARFLTSHGFSIAEWELLSHALIEHAGRYEVALTEASEFGSRFVIEGIIHTPDGRNPSLRCVWFVDEGETVPRLVTAYPLAKIDT